MRSVRNCNVAVIGGAGFLGSHLTDLLVEDRNCEVTVVDNLVVGRKEFIHPDARFVHHDITGSEEYLRNLFVDREINYVFNYAAWPYVVDSFTRPMHVFNVNTMGAIKVINAAQEAGCEGILQISSAELYGEGPVFEGETDLQGNHIGKIDEEAPVYPHSTYGAAKAAVDSYCQVRWHEAETPVIAMRQFNAYGPRETHFYVIPEIISQIWNQKATGSVKVRLGNNSTRDFQYAQDAVRVAVELLEKGQFGDVYNVGSESSIKIYDLARLIGELMGYSHTEVIEDESRKRPWEIWFLTSDNSKVNSVIDYRHQTSFEDGLSRTIESFAVSGKWGFED